MPIATLDQIQALKEPAPDWMWTVDLTPPSGLPIIQSMKIRDAAFPLNFIENEGRFRGGGFEYFPHFNNCSNISLAFYEEYDFPVMAFLLAWTLKVKDRDDNYGVAQDYCGEGLLQLYDSTGQLRLKVVASGIWPMRRGGFEGLNYEGSNAIKPTCEFSCNDCEVTFGNLDVQGLLDNGVLKSSGDGINNNSQLTDFGALTTGSDTALV